MAALQFALSSCRVEMRASRTSRWLARCVGTSAQTEAQRLQIVAKLHLLLRTHFKRCCAASFDTFAADLTLNLLPQCNFPPELCSLYLPTDPQYLPAIPVSDHICYALCRAFPPHGVSR